jgi:hypothetical protein
MLAFCCLLAVPASSVSLGLRNASYEVFAKELARQTGMPFAVAGKLADRKITVFCRDRPIAEVLARVELALDLHFEPAGKGYLLAQTDAQRSHEDEQAKVDAANLKQRLTETVELIRLIAEAEPSELALLRAGAWPKLAPEHLRRRFNRQQLRLVAGENVLGVLGRTAPAAVVDRLLGGHRLPYSTLQGDGVPVVDERFGLLNGPINDLQPQPTRFIAEFDPLDSELTVWTLNREKLPPNVRFADGRTDGLFSWPHHLVMERNSEIERAGPLDVEEREFAQPLPRIEFKSVPSPLTPQGLIRAADLSEHARVLSEATGMPVVADGSRFVVSDSWETPPPSFPAYMSRLTTGTAAPCLHVAGAKVIEGWIALRPRGWWRILQREIPERTLKSLESAYDRGDGPNLDEYGDFAAQLSREQLAGLRSLSYSRPACAVGFPVSPFNNSGLSIALALYGSLNPSQRREGVLWNVLPERQRSLLDAAILDRLQWGATITQFRSAFAGQDRNGWGFRAWAEEPERRFEFPDLEVDPRLSHGALPFHWGKQIDFLFGPADQPVRARFNVRLKSN